MGLADKAGDFKFSRPGKSKEPAVAVKVTDDEPSKNPSRAELGDAFKEAMDSGDGEAIFEAVRKIVDNKDAE